MGAERVIELMQEGGKTFAAPLCRVYIAHQGGETELIARAIGERLRDAGILTIVHAGSTSFKSQMKRADASMATWVVIAGQEEVAGNAVSVKRLRDETGNQVFDEQKRILMDEIETIVRSDTF